MSLIVSHTHSELFFKVGTSGRTCAGVRSAGLAAGVSAGRPAALLLPRTVTVMTAKLCTHEGSLGGAAAARFHCGRQEQQ